MRHSVRIFVLIFALLLEDSATQIIIGTWGTDQFQRAAQVAWDSLKSGRPRVEALVDGLSECESERCDGTVGYGGSPDERGETTLDALLLDGPNHEMGAVAALRRVKSAARVAWAVMNFTEHSMLAGDQATQFAVQMGFPEETLQTADSKKLHQKWLNSGCQPNFWRNVAPDPKAQCGPYAPIRKGIQLFNKREIYEELERFNHRSHDTLGLVVIDRNGGVSAGTTTNGAGNKIPGRVGDSPIPGAGAFVDNSVGGAAATGDGDIMMRFLPSMVAVEGMRNGLTPRRAAQHAIRRIRQHYPNFFGGVVAASVKGAYGAACNGMVKFAYSLPTDSGPTVETVYCET